VITPSSFRAKSLAAAEIAGCLLLWCSSPAVAQAITPDKAQLALDASNVALDFNEQFLMRIPGGPRVDLGRFNAGSQVLPGSYRSDIFLNGVWLARADVLIKVDGQGLQAYACLNKALVNRLGIDHTGLSVLAQRMLGLNPAADAATPQAVGEAPPPCLALDQVIEGGTSHFEGSEQRLDLTVPQALVARRARGYVDPESWDYGVNAALLNYRFSNYQTQSASGSTSQSYLGLNAGFNIGGWQLRHDGNLVDNSGSGSGSGSGSSYQSINTYVRHDVVALRSTFMLGDAYTDGQLFDSYSLQGVTLASDDRMLPDSLRGFAPTIRGQAFSQANVEVRQNGVLLYATSVAPGPFVINDLYPTGFGGDLEVTVIEADGSRRTTQVPFSSAPQLLRDGGFRYSVSGGKYRQSAVDLQVVQGQLQYGLSNTFTAAGGFSVTKEYQAVLIGGAFNTPLGALSLDYTHSRFDPPGLQTRSGDSWRASWSKLFEPTRTNFSLAAYRYSSENFFTLQDAASTLDQIAMASFGGTDTSRVQSNLKVSINQSMGRWGSLYLSGASTSYWSYEGQSTSYQMGYSQQFGTVMATMGVTRQAATAFQLANSQVFVSLTIPLESRANRSGSLNVTQQHDDIRGDSTQANYWGSYGDNYETNYGVFATHAAGSDTAGGNVSYRSNYGQFGLGISDGGDGAGTTTTLTAEGGLVLHAGGITAANTLGDTIGLIKVEEGQGVSVEGNQGAPVNSSGYSVVRYLTPYAANAVVLDMSKASLDTQLEATDQVVAPHAGSVVMLKFAAILGHTILVEGRLTSGAPLPFGADVFDEQNQQVGAVGQAGRLEARVSQAQGRLTVKWGESADQRCALTYAVPEDSDHQHKIVQLKALCAPVDQAAPSPKLLSQQNPALQQPARPAVRGAVLTIRLPDGTPLPKGARVSDQSGSEGATGEAGHVYVKPALVHDGLLASWLEATDGQEHSCQVRLKEATATPDPAQCTASVQWIEKVETSQVSLVDSAH
jgi:outer membrane usher protein